MQATVKSPTRRGCQPDRLKCPRGCDVLPPKSFRPAQPNWKSTFGGSMKRLEFLVAVLICLLAAMPAAYSQSVTGQITGTVADSAGAVIPGAVVKLTNDLSQQIHTFNADSNGSF